MTTTPHPNSCDWRKGKTAIPDLKKCKGCPYSMECLGRNYLKWKKLKREHKSDPMTRKGGGRG